jgi:hypothetical protein
MFFALRKLEPPMSQLGGDLNRSTQHLLILPDQEVCAWMHGPAPRRISQTKSTP